MRNGLDADTLEMMLSAIGEFAAHELLDSRLIELDEAEELPEAIVRRMCLLLMIPEPVQDRRRDVCARYDLARAGARRPTTAGGHPR